jgi:hypothetical protein
MSLNRLIFTIRYRKTHNADSSSLIKFYLTTPLGLQNTPQTTTTLLLLLLLLLLLTATGLSPGGSGHFTCSKNMKLVTDTFNFKSGGLHEKHVAPPINHLEGNGSGII